MNRLPTHARIALAILLLFMVIGVYAAVKDPSLYESVYYTGYQHGWRAGMEAGQETANMQDQNEAYEAGRNDALNSPECIGIKDIFEQTCDTLNCND